MVCRLLPVTQFHSQVSVLPCYMANLSSLAHSTQQAAYPHWHNHGKNPQDWLNASVKVLKHSWNLHPINIFVFQSPSGNCSVIYFLNGDFCCYCLQILTLAPIFSPLWKLCSRHSVTSSLAIVLRTHTNNYFLLFSPFTVYRWKNPQYKFLLLLDRQWPMYAQCRRCLFLV